jgi:hypothetical protein
MDVALIDGLVERYIFIAIQVDQQALVRQQLWHLTRMGARWPFWDEGKSAWTPW